MTLAFVLRLAGVLGLLLTSLAGWGLSIRFGRVRAGALAMSGGLAGLATLAMLPTVQYRITVRVVAPEASLEARDSSLPASALEAPDLRARLVASTISERKVFHRVDANCFYVRRQMHHWRELPYTSEGEALAAGWTLCSNCAALSVAQNEDSCRPSQETQLEGHEN